MFKRISICIWLIIISNTIVGQNIKKAWLKALKGCGSSQIVGKESLFFGPSNTIGLGSVWRKTENKGYNPRFELSDLITDSLELKKVVKLGEKSDQCDANKDFAWEAKIDIPFLGPIFGLTGVSANLQKAKRTSITVNNLALDLLKEVQFEQAIKAINLKDSQNVFVKDILNNRDRLIVTKAYRITGLTIKLDYDPKVLEELKTEYPDGASINLGGENGLKVGFKYKSASELILKLPKEVYIAGEFSRVKANGTIDLEDTKTIRLQIIPVKLDTQAIVGKIEMLK